MNKDQRQTWFNQTAESLKTNFGIELVSDKTAAIQKLYRKICDYLETGQSDSGRIPYPETGRTIEYLLTNKPDTLGRPRNSINFVLSTKNSRPFLNKQQREQWRSDVLQKLLGMKADLTQEPFLTLYKKLDNFVETGTNDAGKLSYSESHCLHYFLTNIPDNQGCCRSTVGIVRKNM